jgi:MFS family permease
MSSRDIKVIAMIGTGHFLSHFYTLCLPPLFLTWREEFGVSYAALGLAVALMAAVTALLQTPVGFLVDRYGARPFLVGGVLLMALSISAMAFAPNYETILVLALLSGVGNSVIHPADYAILGSSVDKSRMGRVFALHTFTGNAGFTAGPPVIAAMLLVMDWRTALLILGLLGLPTVVAIIWQSRILQEQKRPERKTGGPSGKELLLSRPMLLFFGFFMLSAMANGAFQTYSITIFGTLFGTPLAVASVALTGYMAGGTGGTLIGGWFADRSQKHLAFVILFSGATALGLVVMGLVAMPAWLLIPLATLTGVMLGASRTPRDVMLRNAAPPGEMGKVFGFVSSALPLGQAITPVPFGFMIDIGLAWLVLPVAAALIIAALFCMGNAAEAAAEARALRQAQGVPAE